MRVTFANVFARYHTLMDGATVTIFVVRMIALSRVAFQGSGFSVPFVPSLSRWPVTLASQAVIG
ncbi:MAG: hypothetical protein JJ934_11040 [Pseudomonadales bacterium]|nr:hypothetical protein [Pseudomonadales bacterium]